MIRLLLIAANLFSVLALRFSGLDGGADITTDLPGSFSQGDNNYAEISISKDDLSEFGKLELSLPKGVSVKAHDAVRSVFSQREGSAQWTWTNLPEGEKLVIHLNLHSDREINAPEVATRLLFVREGKKELIESGGFPESIVTSAQQQEEAKVSLNRELSLSSTEIEVSITIAKDGTSGFARYSDVLPKNMEVENAVTDGASFSIAEGKVRFVWVNVPAKDTLRISYTLKGKGPGKVTLGGEYSYLDNNRSRKKMLDPEVVEMTADGTASYPKRAETRTKKTKPGNKKKGQQEISAKVTPPSKGELSYRVQIGAFKNNKVTVSRLSKKFRLSEPISSHMHEGYFKFMTADHTEYRDARDHREKLKNSHNIRSAFVVAYNNGKRITVQEALMISKQKWYK